MNNPPNKASKKQQRWWWKILLGLFLLVVVGLVLVILNINSIARSGINRALKHNLSEGGVLDTIDIRLKEGRIELHGLTINPPKGFGNDPLLSLNKFEVTVDPASLFDDEIVVEQLIIKELALVLMRDQRGQWSLTKLPSPDQGVNEPQTTDDTKANKPLSMPYLRVNRVRLEGLSVRLIDQLHEHHWSARLRLDLNIEDLYLKDMPNGGILLGATDLNVSEVMVEQPQGSVSGQPWRAGLKRLDLKIKGAVLGDIAQRAISLDSLVMDLQEVAVDQPAGFGSEKFASLGHLSVTAGKLDLTAPELVINQVLIERPASSIYVQKDSSTNVQTLKQLFFGASEEQSTDNDAPEATSNTSASKSELPVVRVDQIKIKDGAFNLRDESSTEEPLVFPLRNIQFAATQVRLFGKGASVDPSPVAMSFELEQPGELPTAYFGGLAAIGPIGTGVPLVNSQARLIGFKLKTLGALIPPAADITLGATGFDAELALALDADSIHVDGAVVSDKNVHYDSIKVRGPLDTPEVKMGTLLAGVYSRMGDGLLNLGLKGFGVGASIVEGGLGIAKEIGSGTLKFGKSIGASALEVGTGLATLDKEKVKEGIKDSTKDTVKITSGTIQGSGSAAKGGVGRSVSGLKGDAQLQAWSEGIPERFQAAMQQAQEALAKMPYPPVTD